jgi:hypothetical protein
MLSAVDLDRMPPSIAWAAAPRASWDRNYALSISSSAPLVSTTMD